MTYRTVPKPGSGVANSGRKPFMDKSSLSTAQRPSLLQYLEPSHSSISKLAWTTVQREQSPSALSFPYGKAISGW